MLNMYDFITLNASYFKQLKFGREEDIFLDYNCAIPETTSRVWTHKNCLIYVLQGTKRYGSFDLFHKAQQGELLFIRKGGYVIFQDFDKPYRALIFMFGDETVRNLLIEYPNLLSTKKNAAKIFMEQPEILVLESSKYVESIFYTANEYLDQPDTESNISLEFKFKELLVNLLRNKNENAFNLYLSWLSLDPNLSFIKLMQENAHLNFTTKELAKAAGMSLTTFKRKFSKHFNIAPGKWLHQQRLERAKSMLQNQDIRVSEIAFELGFRDVAAFSKSFKRDTGMTPSDFLHQ